MLDMLDNRSDKAIDPALLSHFAAIVGDKYAITDPSAQAPYLVELRDLFRGHSPMVLRPGSVAEVSAILKLANETGTAIVPQGGNTGLVGGQIPQHNEIVLALNRLEAFHGAQVADTPFRPTRDISGFRTGPLGMGHVLLMVPGIDKAFAFYRDVLGFRVSDYIRAPVKAYFLHVNPRHHSLALVEGPKNVMHHLMVELYSLDDVGQCYDLALSEQDRIAVKFGRHSNDLMTSFYQRTPSDILVEYGWGGRDVDDATWKPKEMATVGSLWGHQGLFDNLADRPAPGAAPPPMPAPMRRAPVQVIDGNYERLHGVCPWWDAQRRA